MKSKARSIALASAVKIDESSGIRCILLWLSDITNNQPLSLPLTHQYKFVGNSYNDCIFLKSSFNMCGFDSDFSRNVIQKVFQVVSYTKLEYLVLNVFSIFCGLVLTDFKRGEILMPNDLIALGFCSYKPK